MIATSVAISRPLPTQPIVAAAVLRELAKGTESQLTQFVEIDPCLTAAVMQAANAPHLRHSRRVASVRQAMVLLGTTAIEAIAASRTAALVLTADDVGWPPGFWVRSVAAAAASRVLAERLSVNADEAFTCGMIHDLGDLILFRSDPDLHPLVRARLATGARSLLDLETSLLGAAHTDVGADQLEMWRLPKRVVNAVRRHHAPSDSVVDDLERAVWGGVRLGAAVVSTTGSISTQGGELSSPAAVLQFLGISERPERILADIDRRVESVVTLAGGGR